MMISRFCHELAGPIGAVSNGLELANEFGGDMSDEAMSMAGISAFELVSRMKFYRIAYGFLTVSYNDFTEFYDITNDFINNDKVKLYWNINDMPKLSIEEYRLILNMIAFVKVAVIDDGNIYVDVKNNNIIIKLSGDNLSYIKDLIEVIDVNIEIKKLSPSNIHGYWTACLARKIGRNLHYNKGENEIIITA